MLKSSIISFMMILLAFPAVSASEPPLTLLNVSVVDPQGQSLDSVFVNQKVFIKSQLESLRQDVQKLTYIVLIKDKDGFTVQVKWIEGILEKDLTIGIPWIPKEKGKYTTQVFVWTDLDKAVPLAWNPLTLAINVVES